MDRGNALSRVALLAGLALADSASAAQAREIKFPKDKPKVAFEVPDGWTVDETPLGIELRAPEKNSFVIANLLKRERPVVDGWSRKANESLMAEGVKFDKNAKAPPPPAKAAASVPPLPTATADAPLNPFTLSGAPSPELQSAPPSEIQPPEGPVALMPDKLGGIAQPDKPKLSYSVVQFYGASVADKPVDVQLVVFKVSREELFLMEQESGSDDNRAISIITSVKPAN